MMSLLKSWKIGSENIAGTSFKKEMQMDIQLDGGVYLEGRK